MNTGEILQEIGKPGRELLFVDDSGTPEKPLNGLVKDYIVMCGIVIDSERYNEIVEKIDEHLAIAPVDLSEMHTTEILQAPSRSPWSQTSDEYRIKSLILLHDLVKGYGKTLPYLYIGAEQYEELVTGIYEVDKPQKKGTKEAYYYAAINADWLSGPCAIFYDSEVDLKGRMKILNLHDCNMLCGGFIEASSDQVHGLQLADFAAYLLNRMYHIRDRVEERKKHINRFDSAILDAFCDLEDLYKDMLREDGGND